MPARCWTQLWVCSKQAGTLAQRPGVPRCFMQRPACTLTVTQPLRLALAQRMWQGHMRVPAVQLFRLPPGLRCAASRTCCALFSPAENTT